MKSSTYRFSHSLREPRWTPTAEEERALPPALVWRVDLIDDTTDASLEFAQGTTPR